MADPKDFSNKTIVKQNQLGVPLGNKTVLGQLTTYNDGSAKWTYAKDTNPLIAGPGDRSTFTLYKDSAGKWVWTPTTSTSVPNLSSRESITEKQINDALYQDKAPANAVLSAGNVTNLGGINAAKKFGVPGTTGQATVTGPLPSTVSGNFNGQSGATVDEETGQSQGISTPATTDAAVGSDAGLPGSGGGLRYPLDMAANQDHILFTMVETLPRALGESGANSFSIAKRSPPKKSLGTVILPIQSGIADANSVGWGQGDLDPLSIAGAKIFRDAAMKGLNTVGGNVGSAVEDITKNADAAKAGVTYAAMAEALGKPANELLARTTGTIINPNLELLFNGVTLRPFNFTFRMSARDKDEGEQILKIIYFFKKGMAAKQTKSGFFLKQPYVFDIQYKFNGGDHPGMNKIKTCALQNFGVNYTPDGQYMSHADGVLSAYEITMQFTELDPLYFDDYDGTHKIGY